MFSFLPQILILISLVGIIVILLRKAPGVTNFFRTTPLLKLPSHGARMIGQKLKQGIGISTKKLWHLVLEVKEISTTKAFSRLPKTFSRFRFPRPTLGFFKAPDSPEYYLSQAQESLEREEYADAERKFIKVLEKDAKNEVAYAGLGKLYLAQKKFEEAIQIYKFLLKTFSANDTNHANLGQAFYGQKLYDQAIEAYEQAIELAPENARRYINLGLTLEAKKHIEEAILNYRKAIDLEKQNTQFLLILAEALIKKNDKEEAEILLERILQLEPTNHLAREKLMQLKY